MTLNLDYLFYQLYSGLLAVFNWVNAFRQSEKMLWLIIFWALLAFLLAGWLFYLNLRLYLFNREDGREMAEALKNAGQVSVKKNADWEKILAYLELDNPSDWKLAIIEADVMLDKLVSRMGYPGNNLGERLKTIEPSDFLTLQDAWEAHKARNAIAHEASYQLSHHEARRVIGLFKRVFEEFYFI
ncbi:MAG: hypothetical protein WDZ85_00935 [Candidatus Paceibacterota bacterium]